MKKLLSQMLCASLLFQHAIIVYAEDENEPAAEETKEIQEQDDNEPDDSARSDESFEEDKTTASNAYGIWSDETEIGLHPNEGKQLTYYLDPADSDEIPEWNLDWANNNCITLSNTGYVQATGNTGSASVTASISSGWSITYTVFVSEDPASIAFEKEYYTIGKDGYKWVNINTDYWTSGECRKHIESSDTNIVRPAEEWTYRSGVELYGVNPGIAKITVKTDNGKIAYTEVTVKEGIANSIGRSDYSDLYMKADGQLQLTYEISPSDTTEKPVWTTRFYGNECFTVDQNGLVTALNQTGDGYVYATIENGDYASYHIYVTIDPTALRFNQDHYEIPAGYTGDFLVRNLIITPSTLSFDKFSKTVKSKNEDVIRLGDNSLYIWDSYPGSSEITVTASDGISAETTVTVLEGYAYDISADNVKIYMKKDADRQLSYSLRAQGSTHNEAISWVVKTGNDIVSVDSQGIVHANQYGIATVEARTALYGTGKGDDNNYCCTYTIIVTEDPVSLHFGHDEYTIGKGWTGYLYAISDSVTSDGCVKTYSSEDSSILRVSSDGYFTANSEGDVEVTCTANNGVKATALVHVVQKPDGADEYISNRDQYPCLRKNDEIDLKLNLYKWNGTDVNFDQLEWESADPSIATVSDDGIVKGISPGNAYIIVTDKSTGFVKQRITVFVYDDISDFRFAADDYYINIGDDLNLRHLLVYEPANTLFKDVSFTSQDETVAPIKQENSRWGAVGKKAGSTLITASGPDGQKATFILHVGEKEAAQTIAFNQNGPFTVHKNYRLKPNLKIMPVFADQSNYVLTSADPSIAVIVDPYWYDMRGQQIQGVNTGSTTVTAALKSDPSVKVTFDVNVIDGEANTYQYKHFLSEIDICNNELSLQAMQDEYICYIGRRYDFNASASWTMHEFEEVPAINAIYSSNFTAENGCIQELYAGRGAAMGPDSFNSTGTGFPFMAAREGTAIVHTVGNRTVTLRVVPEPNDLEILADEIINAEDPEEIVSFEGDPEEIKEKIEEAKNNDEALTVELEKEPLDSISDAEETIVINAVHSDEEIGIDYFDINLLLKTEKNDETIAKIVETTEPITVTLPLSEEAIAAGGEYKVVRVHEGIADVLECTVSEDGRYISFVTDKFSTYAVVYNQKEIMIQINGSSLATEGKIGVNFYLDIPEGKENDLTVKMTMGDSQITMQAAEGKKTDNGWFYSYPVAAKEMRDEIILTVSDGQGKAVKLVKDETEYSTGYSYSAAAYFQKAEEIGSEKIKALTRVMDNYGKYAQIYFNYKVTDEVKMVTDVSSVTLETLKPYQAVMTSEEVEGLSYIGASTMLDDAIGYKLYFDLADGHSIKNYQFKIDGKEAVPALSSGKRYYIEVSNIAAKELGNMNTITVTDSKTVLSIQYCPLSYVYKALELTDPNKTDLQNMCRAMYLYNQQAIEYFGS